MCTVQILMSTYNGEKYIRRQIDSIMAQEDIEVHLLVRDDGSKDNTVSIVREYVNRYPSQVELVTGENMGYKKSFLTLIQLAGEYDYYAFADQDDYWLPDKEISSIHNMVDDDWEGPKLAQVNLEVTDENLKPLVPPPEHRSLTIKVHDEVYAGDFFQGCLMTWNRKAMSLLKSYIPQGIYSHDHWVGKVIYLLGKVYLVDETGIYYSRHGDNASTTDDKSSGRWLRLKSMLRGDKHVYDNMGKDLLEGYRELLAPHDIEICNDYINYKHSVRAKLRLLFNFNLRRPSLMGTLFYKLNLFLNRI